MSRISPNRTILELKQWSWASTLPWVMAPNRTILELKHVVGYIK